MSSEYESDADAPTDSPKPKSLYFNRVAINVEQLVREVKKRPPLWNRKSPKYDCRPLRTKLWDQVCESIYGDIWAKFSVTQQNQKSIEIQKKWRNLKDTFFKELAIQKKLLAGQAVKRKRKYIFFELLSFLASSRLKKEPVEIEVRTNDPLEESAVEIPLGFLEERTQSDDHSVQIQENISFNSTSWNNTASNTSTTKDRDELELLLQRDQQYDEDICFSRMLVPMLKRLNDDQKHYAKVEMLNILNVARNYTPQS